MKKVHWIGILLVAWLYGVERDYLSPDAGFVGVGSWRASVYDRPGGRRITDLSVFEAVEVVDKTNLSSPASLWYEVKVSVPDAERVVRGWMQARDLFSERDFASVKKIIEWYLFVEFATRDPVVCHVLPTGMVWQYEHGEKTQHQLRVYRSIFSLGDIMMYYDGTNTMIPWAKRWELLTNQEIFPLEEDVKKPLFAEYILTGDRVNLRAQPSTNALVIRQLSRGETVQFLWRVGREQKIAGKRGFWARVRLPGRPPVDGYVFDPYLKRK